MDRKEFLKKSFLSGLALSAGSIYLKSNVDREKKNLIEQVGFNHIPKKEEKVMNTIIHRSNTRGHANHGWLNTKHSFSFANYYNPERMNFGVLRVINDDIISGGKGFGTHPHDNMEIITIPLSGALAHKDSMGNSAVINEGDIQVMSAGTGIFHSEFNHNADKDVTLFQIWLFPNRRNVEPRYDQMPIREVQKENELYQILSPNKNDQGVWIYQDAWFHMGTFTKETELTYKLKKEGNGVYIMVVDGLASIEGHDLLERDAIGIWDTNKIAINAQNNTKILIMEIPMEI